MKHNFEERRQNRIDHAQEQAAKNEQKANSLYEQAKKMASAIPMGQPILVGHHSEKRDRNYRKKIHNKFGQSFEAQDTSAYYQRKAETIENNTAIFSDDPAAITKLKEKLSSLEATQAFMKEANRCIRSGNKSKFLQHPFASETLWTELNTPDWAKRVGFAPYQLSNNNARITSTKNRIAHLEQLEILPEMDITVNGIRLYANKEANRVQVFFPSIPAEDIRKRLKQHGFRWCRSEKAWQRHLNPYALRTATEFLQQL